MTVTVILDLSKIAPEQTPVRDENNLIRLVPFIIHKDLIEEYLKEQNIKKENITEIVFPSKHNLIEIHSESFVDFPNVKKITNLYCNEDYNIEEHSITHLIKENAFRNIGTNLAENEFVSMTTGLSMSNIPSNAFNNIKKQVFYLENFRHIDWYQPTETVNPIFHIYCNICYNEKLELETYLKSKINQKNNKIITLIISNEDTKTTYSWKINKENNNNIETKEEFSIWDTTFLETFDFSILSAEKPIINNCEFNNNKVCFENTTLDKCNLNNSTITKAEKTNFNDCTFQNVYFTSSINDCKFFRSNEDNNSLGMNLIMIHQNARINNISFNHPNDIPFSLIFNNNLEALKDKSIILYNKIHPFKQQLLNQSKETYNINVDDKFVYQILADIINMYYPLGFLDSNKGRIVEKLKKFFEYVENKIKLSSKKNSVTRGPFFW